MRGRLAWLCLFLAATGPFVCQARIAYGVLLARSEIGSTTLESGQEVEDEEYDGRDLAAVLSQSNHDLSGPAHDFVNALTLATCLPILFIFPRGLDGAGRPRPGWKWPPPTASERAVLLQRLQF